jgi:nucleotide-binding universal stress UspA family protein
MTIRTILAAASGGSASNGALDLACQLARRCEAHLEGFHAMPDAGSVLAAMGDGIGAPAPVGLIDTVLAEAASTAARARALFDEAIARHGIAPGATAPLALHRPSASWREETGSAPPLVARRARFFDLAVLGRSDRVVNEPHSDTIEETVLRSGRPVLLAPSQPPSGIGYVIAVAWDGSPPAVRSLAAALPLLRQASAVTLITAGDIEPSDAQAAIDHLAWHEVNAEHRAIAGGSARQIGAALIGAAREAGADLLVMGGYGHPPWREMLFGGATRTAVATMPLPLLLMH